MRAFPLLVVTIPCAFIAAACASSLWYDWPKLAVGLAVGAFTSIVFVWIYAALCSPDMRVF